MMKRILIFCFLLFGVKMVFAQDPVFTQSFIIPESINTGFTGSDNTTRAGFIHRVQWPSTSFRINTQFAFVDTFVEGINSGVGLSILNQQENTTGYRFSQINYNHALEIRLNRYWYFRPSVSVGVGMKSFGFQNLLLEDQINLNTGIVSTSSIDPVLLNDELLFFDFSSSLLFHNDNSWVGVTLRHLTRPNISFTFQGNVPLDMFFSAHGAYDLFNLFPTFSRTVAQDVKLYVLGNYMMQGQYSRLDFGLQLAFERFSFGLIGVMSPNENSNFDNSFLTSINLMGGFKWKGWKFSYSYDITTNKIGNTGGIYEIMVAYDFGNGRSSLSRCPRIF